MGVVITGRVKPVVATNPAWSSTSFTGNSCHGFSHGNHASDEFVPTVIVETEGAVLLLDLGNCYLWDLVRNGDVVGIVEE